MLIGNVSTDNPDTFPMKYFMEWVLVLRSPEDLLRLAPKTQIATKVAKAEVIEEPLGLNLFLKVEHIGIKN